MRRTVSQRSVRPTLPRTSEPVAITAALLALCALLAGPLACTPDQAPEAEAQAEPARAADFVWPTGPRPSVTLHIEGYGDIEIELYRELAPITVDNFLKLAAEGFYDGTTFHRVIADFMIQGGDPLSRDDDPKNDGYGDPGYTIPDEQNAAPHVRGALSMANKGRPDTGGSQFFIIQQDARYLDGQHTVFGRVVAGLEVVDRIASTETDLNGRWGKRHRPLEHIVLSGTTVGRIGETAGRAPAKSPPPKG